MAGPREGLSVEYFRALTVNLISFECPGSDSVSAFWLLLGQRAGFNPRTFEFFQFRLHGVVLLLARLRGLASISKQRDTDDQKWRSPVHGFTSLGGAWLRVDQDPPRVRVGLSIPPADVVEGGIGQHQDVHVRRRVN